MDVKTLCLSVLSQGDATGYEIKKTIEESAFSHFVEASYGSIYPALGKLTEDGLISVRTEPLEGRPDKKIYSLTPAGLDAFRTMLAETPAEDKFRSNFLFQMLFAHYLTPEQITEKLERQIARCRERRDYILEKDPAGISPGEAFARGFGLALANAAIDYLDSQRGSFAKSNQRPASARDYVDAAQ